MSQPFYHLRPNKYVDRCLFVAALEGINTIIKLKAHRYIGFGSYLFDDFKLLHDRLDISSMISLEADSGVYRRALYNIPYSCIRVENQTSTDFIAGGEWGADNTIIWLDYTAPGTIAQQFNDIASLSNILNPRDIVRVTFNASPVGLGTPKDDQDLREFRLSELRNRIGEYIPVDVTLEDMVTKNYPVLLLKCLHKMLGGMFKESKFDRRFLLPLFSTVYKDGQMMVTFTGIVLDNHDEEASIRNAFEGLQFVNFEWEKPARVSIPDLTVKEILEINKLLPSENAQEQIKGTFEFVFADGEYEINSYVAFYKYYPSFHRISL